jgi:prepilin-type processing-associated H-X9-DG protein
VDHDNQNDTWSNYGYAYNWGRPTVYNGGANVTAADGHVERVAFRVLWKMSPAKEMVSRFWYME